MLPNTIFLLRHKLYKAIIVFWAVFGQVVYMVSPGALHVYSVDFAEVKPKNKKGGSNKS